ncbi:MAG: SDR family NAD(P)-dependent oxidoreductase [Myxococcota bacterium]
MHHDNDRYGPWAIVTGASQGIGEGFARALAAKGCDLVLVSRRASRLETLASDLRATFGIQTRVVAADLSQAGSGRAVMDAVDDLDVGLLVSNAGGAHMGGFLQTTIEHLAADLTLNARSHLELTHAFAGRLRGRGRGGGILLVSSTAALQPMALGANYSAAKAYLLNLGESIHRELSAVDIDVTVLLPGPTNTQGLNDRNDIAMGKLPMTAMPVAQLVEEGLTALHARRSSHVAGALNRWSTRLLPRRLSAWMYSTLLRRNAAPALLPTAPMALSAAPSKRSHHVA